MKSLVDRMEQLEFFGSDLTKMAKQGQLDPVIGRENKIERILQILGKKKQNNLCLVGDPGVGKTGIVEGVAQQLANATVPLALQGKLVFALDMVRVITACSSNPGSELKDIMTGILEEIRESNGTIILFIDDLPAVLGAVSIGEEANAMKSFLARGEIKCIVSTTPDEYSKYIEKDSSLRSHFQAVNVPELAVDETIEVLKRLSRKYEQYHGVRYEQSALVAAARLSKKYSSDCFLPGKAVDLIDEAGSRVKLVRNEGSEKKMLLVIEEDVRQVVSMIICASRNMINRTVRIFTKADPNYSLTIRDGKVILAPSDPGDEYQHWYKNESPSWAKDEFGRPAFSLVNKASGEALEHSIGETHSVGSILLFEIFVLHQL
ncbi:hypothetical protein QN277_020822 [Acacia crassicarpa]|uniref:AAA+ ATPase domain-containing protein n=1 Tax=Acacia crassicarpa TaxID=499986 RepID=A0AAE1JMD8_9FABA|nr:hypothetical protein QN277_020822 [Acacia crassicarpa]